LHTPAFGDVIVAVVPLTLERLLAGDKCSYLMENQSVKFYDTFASKYDMLISNERYDEDLPFFNSIFKKHNVKSILDCSCGTGKHVIKFSQLGLEATGSDVSIEMINSARRNAKLLGIEVDFVQGDFKRLPDVFDKKFDCVICIGNSLNHELKEKGILSALRSMYKVLSNRGAIIIQIRNLPKLVKEKRRVFPIHYHKEPNGDRKIFLYVLDFYRTKVKFNVISILELNEKPTFEADSVDQRIVSAQKLKELMMKIGYRQLKTYGDFQFAKFNDEHSEDIIIVGTK
jgi:glycine/sarcosine N-methyltransferase